MKTSTLLLIGMIMSFAVPVAQAQDPESFEVTYETIAATPEGDPQVIVTATFTDPLFIGTTDFTFSVGGKDLNEFYVVVGSIVNEGSSNAVITSVPFILKDTVAFFADYPNLDVIEGLVTMMGTNPNDTVDQSFEVNVFVSFDFTGGNLSVPQEDDILFNVYPNPATDMVTVSGLKGGEAIKLLDLSGKTVFTGIAQTDKLTIPLSGMQSGVYLIQVADRTKKLIVQ